MIHTPHGGFPSVDSSAAEERPISVGTATSADFAVLGDICVRAYRPSRMRSDDPYYRVLGDVAARAQQSIILVARLAGVPVGTVTWCPPGCGLRELANDDQAEIRTLAVDPHYQGRGIGGALLSSCIERAWAAGLQAIVLSSSEWMTVAHHMYEHRGFVRTPESDWWPRPDVRLISYRLDLN